MVTVTEQPGAQRRLLTHPGLAAGLQQIGERIQTEVVRLNADEAVDSGLMTASWRVQVHPGNQRISATVGNTAHSETGAPYPAFVEFG